jgi:hypothetical protein
VVGLWIYFVSPAGGQKLLCPADGVGVGLGELSGVFNQWRKVNVERRIRLAIGRGLGGVGGLGGRFLQDITNLIGIDFIYHRSIVFSLILVSQSFSHDSAKTLRFSGRISNFF